VSHLLLLFFVVLLLLMIINEARKAETLIRNKMSSELFLRLLNSHQHMVIKKKKPAPEQQ